MKRLLFALPLLAACAPAHYLYGFDVVEPGAVNFKDFRRPDVLEDPNVKLEVRADPTELRAIALDVTNRTEVPLLVEWGRISIISPDHMERRITPQQPLGEIEPSAKLPALLATFELPSVGDSAKMNDGQVFELVVPVGVRGAAREYRVHLRATVQKL